VVGLLERVTVWERVLDDRSPAGRTWAQCPAGEWQLERLLSPYMLYMESSPVSVDGRGGFRDSRCIVVGAVDDDG